MTVQLIPIENVVENQYNPRSHYDQAKIKELASSIRENGLLETPKGHKSAGEVYELAYGGYRLRAFREINKDPESWDTPEIQQYVIDGKLNMPIDILEISDMAMVIYALEENLKRQNMTPMDTANAIAKYFDIFPGAKEDDLAKKLSINQGTISNMRRVTRLPKEVLKYVDSEEISFTQARELVPLMDIDGITNGKIESKLLMINAIGLLGTEGYPKTVKGIQKAIHKTIHEQFLSLDPTAFTSPPIFDTVNCLKCDKAIKTTGDDGKAAYHCLDSECWNLHQKEAQRKKEEDEKATAEKKAQEDVEAAKLKAEAEAQLEKEKAEKEAQEPTPPVPEAPIPEKPPAVNIPQEIKPQPTIIYVAPSRLDDGGDIHDSFSGNKLLTGEPINLPFQERGDLYIDIGSFRDIPGDTLAKKAYKIIPRTDFTGETRSLTPPEGIDVLEYRTKLQADPMGAFNGVVVNYDGKEYVMVGPMVVFAASVFATSAELAAQEPAAKPITPIASIEHLNIETEAQHVPENKVEEKEGERPPTQTVRTTPVKIAAEQTKSAAVETDESEKAKVWTVSLTLPIFGADNKPISRHDALIIFKEMIDANNYTEDSIKAEIEEPAEEEDDDEEDEE